MPSTPEAPRAGHDALAAVRDVLRRNRYSTPRVCERLGIDVPSSRSGSENGDLRSPWRRSWQAAARRHAESEHRDGLDVLIRLFEVSENVSRSALRLAFSEREAAALEATGLLAVSRNERREDLLAPRFRLTEVDGLFIVTDTDETACGPADRGANRYAMPVYLETYLFAREVPTERVRRGLDLCTGCGVHALLMARHVEQVVGTDNSKRALAIARFNAALNGITNVSFRHGSIWDPVGDLTFDRITCNPPYQPDLEHELGANWWGGGARGESLWVPVVRGLLRYLEPDGAAHLILQGLSWRDDAFLQRVQRYAGDLTVTWDVFGAPEIEDYRRRYTGSGLEQLERAEYGVLTIRRVGR